MEILILDRETAALIAVIDEWADLEYTRDLWAPGDCTFRVQADAYGAEALAKGRVVVPDREAAATAYVIEAIERTVSLEGGADDAIRVTARAFDLYLEERLIVPPDGEAYDTQSGVPAETAIKHYVTDHLGSGAAAERQLPNLDVLTSAGAGLTVTVAGRYQTLQEFLEEIGRPSGIGWEITLNQAAGTYEFDTIAGTDRSAEVFFDTAFDSVRSQTWLSSDLGRKTVAYVAGQGEGVERQIVVRPAAPGSGFERRETFVDARDIEVGEVEQLAARGDGRLAETDSPDAFEATIYEFGSFPYRVAWDLGDIVTVRRTRWAVEVAERIVRVTVSHARPGVVPEVTAEIASPMPNLVAALRGMGGDGLADTADRPVVTNTRTGLWDYTTSTTMADPGSGNLRTNTSTPSTSTQMAISTVTKNGTDVTAVLDSLAEGDVIAVQEQADSLNWIRYEITGALTHNAGWTQIPIAAIAGASSGALTNNTPVLVSFTTAGGGGGGGGVTDHGALSGLEDDDHPQYQTTAEVDGQIATHAGNMNAHHSRDHSINVSPSGVHTSSPLTSGHVFKATGTASASFQALVKSDLPSLLHADLSGVGANDHHAQQHVIDGGNHTAAGLTAGHVLTATGASAFAFQAPAVPAHSALSGVTADQHHAEAHVLNGGNHTVSGLTAGHVLRATAAAAYGFQAPATIPATQDTAGDGTTSGTTELTVRQVTITNPAIAGRILIVATVSIRAGTIAGDNFQIRLYFGTTPTQLSTAVVQTQTDANGEMAVTLHGTAAVATAGTQVIRTSIQRQAGTGTVIAAAGQCPISWIIVPGADATV